MVRIHSIIPMVQAGCQAKLAVLATDTNLAPEIVTMAEMAQTLLEPAQTSMKNRSRILVERLPRLLS